MALTINDRIKALLLEEPETGMGWQLVEFRRDYLRSVVMVLNAERAVERAGDISLVREENAEWIRSELRAPSSGLRLTVLPSTSRTARNVLRAGESLHQAGRQLLRRWSNQTLGSISSATLPLLTISGFLRMDPSAQEPL